MTIELQIMTPDHYDRIMALWQSADGVGLSEADSRDAITAYLARNPGHSLVALRGGRLVGAVLCGHDGRRGYIHHLAVAADARHQGIGRQLVQACLAALRRDGIQKCHLFVFRRNQEAIVFWQAIGFTARDELSMMSTFIE